MLEKHKEDNDLSTLNRNIINHPLFSNLKYSATTKYTLNETAFCGNNFWLIKPTDFNRGRGVEVFNTLD